MSPWDVPGALAMVVLGAGAFIGFGLFVTACAVIEKWRGR